MAEMRKNPEFDAFMSECERVNKHFEDVAARGTEDPVPECSMTNLEQEHTIDLGREIDWEAWGREMDALEEYDRQEAELLCLHPELMCGLSFFD
jgi:hypothetical protein